MEPLCLAGGDPLADFGVGGGQVVQMSWARLGVLPGRRGRLAAVVSQHPLEPAALHPRAGQAGGAGVDLEQRVQPRERGPARQPRTWPVRRFIRGQVAQPPPRRPVAVVARQKRHQRAGPLSPKRGEPLAEHRDQQSLTGRVPGSVQRAEHVASAQPTDGPVGLGDLGIAQCPEQLAGLMTSGVGKAGADRAGSGPGVGGGR